MALFSHNMELVRRCLSLGTPVNLAAPEQRHLSLCAGKYQHEPSALHVCVEHECLEALPLLLEELGGASVDSVTDSRGFTPLHWAASRGSVEATRILLAHSASPLALSVKGTMPLHLAARKGFVEVVDLLLAHGATLSPQSSTEETPAHFACAGGKLEMLQYLMQHADDVPTWLARTSSLGMQLHHIAALYGRVEVFDYLVSMGAKWDAKVGPRRYSISGCGVCQKLPQPKTEYEPAAPKLSKEACAAGHSLHQAQCTHLALIMDRAEFLKHLLDTYEVDIDAVDKSRPHPMPLLHLAGVLGSVKCIDLLIQRGANRGYYEPLGGGPAHTAVHHGNVRGAVALLKLGTDVSIRDKNGESVLDFALRQPNGAMMRRRLLRAAHKQHFVSLLLGTVPRLGQNSAVYRAFACSTMYEPRTIGIVSEFFCEKVD